MAKTTAERQAEYRARRSGKESHERRLNTWVSADTYRSLEALSERYGLTRKAVIELLFSKMLKSGKVLPAKSKVSANSASTKIFEKLPRNKKTVDKAKAAKLDKAKPAKTQQASVKQAKKLLRNESRPKAENKAPAAKKGARPLLRNKAKAEKKHDKQIDLFG